MLAAPPRVDTIASGIISGCPSEIRGLLVLVDILKADGGFLPKPQHFGKRGGLTVETPEQDPPSLVAARHAHPRPLAYPCLFVSKLDLAAFVCLVGCRQVLACFPFQCAKPGDAGASAQAALAGAARNPGCRPRGRLPQPCGRISACCRSRTPSGAAGEVRGVYWRSTSSTICIEAKRLAK